MSKHTPGLWYEDGLLFIGTDKAGNGKGCFPMNNQLPNGSWEYTDEEATANIRLIAAAPDLLEACEVALQMPIPWVRSSQGRCDLKKYREAIQAAIDKATS